MALDVVAFLERAMDDARTTNFAGLYYLVTESAIAGAPQALRKGRRLSRVPEELGVVLRGAQDGSHGMLILRCSCFLCEIFSGIEHLGRLL